MFENLKEQPADKILMLMQAYREDPREQKVDLGVASRPSQPLRPSLFPFLASFPRRFSRGKLECALATSETLAQTLPSVSRHCHAAALRAGGGACAWKASAA